MRDQQVDYMLHFSVLTQGLGWLATGGARRQRDSRPNKLIRHKTEAKQSHSHFILHRHGRSREGVHVFYTCLP